LLELTRQVHGLTTQVHGLTSQLCEHVLNPAQPGGQG